MTNSRHAISRKEARRLFLARQGLLKVDAFGKGKNATKKAINQLSWLQIDTISVVERAHHHILRSRVSNATPRMLHQLQTGERHFFEYWSHAAAYLPIDDYRFYLPVMEGSAIKRPPDKKLAPEILRRIRDEGPLQSRDFESPRGNKANGWWNWKPAKVALEQLFLCGELMVSHRDGFQKVYDLRENVLPDHIDTSMPTEQEWGEFIVNRMIGAMGTATEYDIGYARTAIRQLANKTIKPVISTAMKSLLSSGEIVAVDVEGMTHYALPDILSEMPKRIGKKRVTLLSPFDNLIINRKRAQALFDFDYQIECYVPATKRKYGYFSLPVLYGDEIIGRVDTKAERKISNLEIRNLVLESGVKLDDELIQALIEGLTRFATDNNCNSLTLLRASPRQLQQHLRNL